MSYEMHEIVLRANTALFAQKVCQIINDMVQFHYQIAANTLNKSLFTFPGGIICFMHYAGKIQGDYLLAMSEETALTLNGLTGKKKNHVKTEERAISSSLIAEILNIASSKSLPELEKKYSALTISPPMTVFGELILPKIISGNVEIIGPPGKIQCTLAMNMVSLKIIRQLENNLLTG